jgi:hypothetical protein
LGARPPIVTGVLVGLPMVRSIVCTARVVLLIAFAI